MRDKRYRYIRNLTPEENFSNVVFRNAYYKEWLAKAAAGDEHAMRVTDNYRRRPAEELYDCDSDPWNLNNLAEDPEHATIKSDLSKQLDSWMKQQGDQGQATELAAHQHQNRGNKKKKKKK